ncbi:hypothetical protein [Marinitoga aeolica]|uniref:Adhesin domain-containing protein n=1 Tax=Marinitoga aeolica TaxID=2809031 RepID=A0ABY8PNA4_9BACT|nr:hypothetical protein [Marinitoga aeolica]WGS64131.1 hypothetical protein JRV97_07040 [Marinitoga aeolica]
MREYWYFLPLVGVIFILMAFQISDYSIKENTAIPDKITDLKGITEIELNGLNINIKFDPESDRIFYSNILKTSIINGKLKLDSMGKDKNMEIVIGSKNKFNRIKINGLNIQISGKLNSENFNVDGANVIFKDNTFFQGNKIIVNGTNVIIKGEYDMNIANISGISTNIDIQVINCKDIKFDGISVNAKIEYKDTWEGVRTINYDGVSNNVTIRMRKDNKGELKSNKKIKIIRF